MRGRRGAQERIVRTHEYVWSVYIYTRPMRGQGFRTRLTREVTVVLFIAWTMLLCCIDAS